MASKNDTFLDDDFLKKLEKIKIITKKGFRSPDMGGHRSVQSGEGIEFLDYRKYQAGDDLRYVDWSVYGRMDKLFIKLFHAEENQSIHILMDVSRSMDWGEPSKAVCAKKIAAAVGYIGLSNFDKVGLTSFAHKILDVRSPSRGKRKYPELLHFLLSQSLSHGTDVNGSLSEYASISKSTGIVLVISDFFDPKGYEEGLKALTYRNFDIHAVQVLDHQELFWSKTGNISLRETETGEKKSTFIDRALLDLYHQRVSKYISDLESFCSTYNIHYYLHDTRIPFEDFLLDYLTRGALLRG